MFILEVNDIDTFKESKQVELLGLNCLVQYSIVYFNEEIMTSLTTQTQTVIMTLHLKHIDTYIVFAETFNVKVSWQIFQ